MVEGDFVISRQRAWSCTLLSFPTERWQPVDATPRYHMGSLPVIQPERIKRPPETHDEGCPGGWYRCNFVDSMLRYERRMSSDGVFSHNILLDRCNDRLIIEATQYLEQQRLARANFGFELRFRK